jgi:type III secretion system chaperone SycN
MSLVAATLAELAAGFQLPSLAFNRNGVVALILGETDYLTIEEAKDGVLLSLARPLPPHRAGLAEKALRLCGPEGGLPFAVRPGLTGDKRLVLTVYFSAREFTLPETMRCLAMLRIAHTRVTAV